MNNTKIAALSTVSLAAAILLAGAEITSAADKYPIIIGAAIAQSGFVAPYDTDPAKAAEMAIEDVNAKGGVLGYPIKMIYRDTKSDIAGGGVAAQELLHAGAKFFIVTGDFDFGGAAARAANARETLAIAPFAAIRNSVCAVSGDTRSHLYRQRHRGGGPRRIAHKRGWKTAYELTNKTSKTTNRSARHLMPGSRSSTVPTASSAPTSL